MSESVVEWWMRWSGVDGEEWVRGCGVSGDR